MSRELVLDASAALQYLIPDSAAHQQAASALFADITAGKLTAVVPVLFFNEVAGPIARAVRGRRISRSQAEAFFHLIGTVPLSLSIEVLSPGDWFERSMRWGCQVADSAYLQIAFDLKVPLATTDGGMATAVKANKGKLYWPQTLAG